MNGKDKNLSEIVKKCLYAPDNYMLRAMEEAKVEDKVHHLLLQTIDNTLDY